MGAPWLKELAIDKPVREHIQAWEEKLSLLSEQVMDESNAGRRHELETELRAVQSALRFYSRRAGDWAPFLGIGSGWIGIWGITVASRLLRPPADVWKIDDEITSTTTRTQALKVAITAPPEKSFCRIRFYFLGRT
jgi:hypothetical protein